jgi:hypothetical protein
VLANQELEVPGDPAHASVAVTVKATSRTRIFLERAASPILITPRIFPGARKAPGRV